MLLRTALNVTAFSLLVSCGIQSKSELNITNGVKVQPDRLKAVIFQDGCTGTFVSPTTILTAAHCADKGFTYNGVKTTSWESMPEALKTPWRFDIDVRILVFPKAVAPAWIPVSTVSMLGDEDVLVAGFGTFDMEKKTNDGKFRYGTARLNGFEANGALLVWDGLSAESVKDHIGDQSGVGPGDSGGPMFRDGQLVGINVGVAGSSTPNMHKSITVNLTHPSIKSFLDRAVKKGVDIRFNGEGTESYEECFDVSAKEEQNAIQFEVPHSRISSITGTWSVCDSCDDTSAEGYETSPLENFAPKFGQFKLGALIYSNRHQFDSADAKPKLRAWNGTTLELDGLSFGADLQINDNLNYSDNKGSLRVCFK